MKNVLANYKIHPLNSRVKRAMFFYEHAFREFYIDVRWLLISSAMEALINTSGDHITKQFVKRSMCLANFVGGITYTTKDAEKIYNYRSKISHGQMKRIDGLDEKEKDAYAKIEELIRRCLKKSILDPTFASIFNTEESINKKLPI